MTERLHFHFSLACIGEGNGNPLQCSCLENPRDGGAWCAAVYGLAQSWTRLKRLSSSSSSRATNTAYSLSSIASIQIVFASNATGDPSLKRSMGFLISYPSFFSGPNPNFYIPFFNAASQTNILRSFGVSGLMGN